MSCKLCDTRHTEADYSGNSNDNNKKAMRAKLQASMFVLEAVTLSEPKNYINMLVLDVHIGHYLCCMQFWHVM